MDVGSPLFLKLRPSGRGKRATPSPPRRSKSVGSLRSDGREESKPVTSAVAGLNSALRSAVDLCDFEECLMTIDAGADVDYPALSGETALLKACGLGDEEVAFMLIERGASLTATNTRGRTALIKAAASGHCGTVQLLLDFGGDPLAKDKSGKTALDWARVARQHDAARLLEAHVQSMIEHERGRMRKDEHAQRMLARMEVNERLRGKLEPLLEDSEAVPTLLKMLKRRPAVTREQFQEAMDTLGRPDAVYHVDHESRSGWTVLTRACALAHDDLARVAIDAGAALDLETRMNHTPLTWAARIGDERCCQLLLHRGASPDYVTAEQRTALMHACGAGKTAVVELLLDALLEVALARREKSMASLPPDTSGEELTRLSTVWLDDFHQMLEICDAKGQNAAALARAAKHMAVLEELSEAKRRAAARARMLETTGSMRRCHNDCGFEDTIERTIFHELNTCHLRLVKCDCGERVTAEKLEEHEASACPRRMVRCKFWRHGCTRTLREEERAAHEDFICPKRQIECLRGCGEVMCADQQHQHENHACELRPIECPHGCRAIIRSGERAAHRAVCMKFEAPCPKGCGELVVREDLPHHYDTVCLNHSMEAHCTFDGCFEVFRTRRQRNRHQVHMCPKRLVPCPAGCGRDIVFDRLDDHARYECPQASLPCPLGCGLLVARAEEEEHRRALCDNRSVHCPLDLNGKRVKWKDEVIVIVSVDLSGDSDCPPFQVRHADGSLSTMALWDAVPLDVLPGMPWRCEMMPASERLKHARDSCPLRLVDCSLHCGQRLAAGGLEEHIKHRCPEREVLCSLGCGRIMLERLRGKHEAEDCLQRLISCKCGEHVPAYMYDEHLTTCNRGKVLCPQLCNQRVYKDYLELHMLNECPNRIVLCTVGCGEAMVAALLESHEAKLCPAREATCDACGRTMLGEEYDVHVVSGCPEHEVACSLCGEKLRRGDAGPHEQFSCGKRLVSCTLGCGIRLVADAREEHESSACPRRKVPCPFCGEKQNLFDLHSHQSDSCPRRPVSCRFRCGRTVLAEEVADHESSCLRRRVSCPFESDACERPLQSWVTLDGKAKVCELHGESALGWAAKRNEARLMHNLLRMMEPSMVDWEGAMGHTPLTYAAHYGSVDVCELLLERNAYVNKETKKARTAIGEACMTGQVKVVELLIQNGASLSARNRMGQTTIQWARRWGHKEVIERVEFAYKREQALRKLFTAICRSDYGAVEKLVRGGERFKWAHPTVLQQQIVDQREVVKHCAEDAIKAATTLKEYEESVMGVLRSQLAEGESSLSAETARVKKLQQESVLRNRQSKHALSVASTHLQQIELGDVVDFMQAKEMTAGHRLLLRALCVMRGVKPEQRPKPGCPGEFTLLWTRKAMDTLRNRRLFAGLRNLVLQTRVDGKLVEELRELLHHEDMPLPPAGWEYVPEEAETAADGGKEGDAESKGAEEDSEEAKEAGYGEREEGGKEEEEEEKAGMDDDDDDDAASVASYASSRREELGEYPVAIALNVCMRAVILLYDNRCRGEELKREVQAGHNALRLLRKDVWAQQAELERADRVTYQASVAFKREAMEQDLSAKQLLASFERRLWLTQLLNFRTITGHTAVSFAAARGAVDVLLLLLENGSSPCYTTEELEHSAMCLQVAWRRHRWRKTVAADAWGEYESMKVEEDYRWKLRVALDRVAKTRDRNRRPLMEALYAGHLSTAKMLLKHGARLSVLCTIMPQPPPPYSMPRLVTVLPRGSHLSAVEAVRLGRDAMQYITYSAEHGWREHFEGILVEVEKLVEEEHDSARLCGKHIELDRLIRRSLEADNRRLKVLEGAVKSSYLENVVELVRSGAPPDYETADGHTPLSMAARSAGAARLDDGTMAPAVQALLQLGSSVDKPTVDGFTPLMWACQNGHGREVELLLEGGADMELRSDSGMTPLLLAAKAGEVDIVRILVDRGANQTTRDNARNNIHFFAKPHPEVQRLLAERSMGLLGDASLKRGLHEDLVTCPLGCGASMPDSDREVHAGSECPLRQLSCPLGCGLVLNAKDIARHSTKQCVHRIVPCPHSCGVEPMPHSKLEKHLNESCIRTCPWGCGTRLSPHEWETHVRRVCERRRVPCELSCGLHIPLCSMKEHKRLECTRRLVVCRLGCMESMRLEEREVHEVELCEHRSVECSACSEVMLAKEMKAHLAESCVHRLVPCRNKCGVSVPLVDMRQHLKKSCFMRFVPCELGCEYKIRLCDMASHVRNECRLRLIRCERCHDRVPGEEILFHRRHVCPKRLVSCGLGCGQRVLAKDIEDHRKNDCPNREMACSLGCGRWLTAAELEDHVKWKCYLRLMWCGLGCGEKMRAERYPQHKLRECPMRFVKCSLGCGEELREADRAVHEAMQCPRRHS